MKISIRLIVLCLVLLAAGGCGKNQEHLPAVDGEIDLAGLQFGVDGPVSLAGDWRVYWQQLLSPDQIPDISPSDVSDTTVLPGLWASPSGNPLAGAYGTATYCLSVRVSPDPAPKALMITGVLSAARVWVNGVAVTESGTVGGDRGVEVPRRHSLVAEFSSPGDRIDIVLQVSNHHNIRGGLNFPVILGTREQIQQLRNREQILSALMGGALLIMALYHLVLYGLRRSETANLFFGVFCFVWAVRVVSLVPGGALLATLFPRLPWRLSIDLVLLSYGLSMPLIVMFYHALFPKKRGRLVERIFLVLAGVYTLFILLSEPNAFGLVTLCYFFLTRTAVIYLCLCFIGDLIRRKDGVRVLVPGYLFLGLAGLGDMLYDVHLTNSDLLTPYGIIAFILSYSFLISIRFSKTHRKVRNLSMELAERRRTERSLRLTHRYLTGILDAVDIPMVAVGENMEIGFCNRQFEELCGRGASELLGQGLGDLLAPESAPEALSILAAGVRGEKPPETRILEGLVFRDRENALRTVTADLYRLEFDEGDLLLLTLRSPEEAADSENVGGVVSAMNLNQRRLRTLEDTFSRLAGADPAKHPDMARRLEDMDQLLSDIRQSLSGENGQAERRSLIPRVMNQAISYWCEATGSTKFELAKQSGLWKVYTDRDGGQRTQTLDKYLEETSLPRNPRMSQVIRTADFVLAVCDVPLVTRDRLETSLTKLKNVE